MTREQDWRIHTLMGNDLTGWEWTGPETDNFVRKDDDYRRIPHYSTTWEGAGLIIDWMISNDLSFTMTSYSVCILRKSTIDVLADVKVENAEFPQALANAYIAAMEERK